MSTKTKTTASPKRPTEKQLTQQMLDEVIEREKNCPVPDLRWCGAMRQHHILLSAAGREGAGEQRVATLLSSERLDGTCNHVEQLGELLAAIIANPDSIPTLLRVVNSEEAQGFINAQTF